MDFGAVSSPTNGVPTLLLVVDERSRQTLNQFLIDTPHRCIDVEFRDIDLRQLDFERFGEKIGKMKITNCHVEDEYTLESILVRTPNVTRLSFCYDDALDVAEKLGIVIDGLREEGFRNSKLTRFYYHDSDETTLAIINEITLQIRNLVSIFPNLKRTSLHPIVPLRAAEVADAFDTLEAFSKLESIRLRIEIKEVSSNLLEEFFSWMTSAKDLDISISFDQKEFGCDKYRRLFTAEQMLMEIARCCVRIRKITLRLLGFTWVTNVTRDENTEVYSLTNEKQHLLPPHPILEWYVTGPVESRRV